MAARACPDQVKSVSFKYEVTFIIENCLMKAARVNRQAGNVKRIALRVTNDAIHFYASIKCFTAGYYCYFIPHLI